jgi:hypothetical protein
MQRLESARLVRRILPAALAVALLTAPAHGATVEDTVEAREETNAASAESQAKIDLISDDIDKMVAEYRTALSETRALEVYNDQVEQLIVAQEREVASLREQIDGVTRTGRQITPLMLRMIDTLESFVALDVPFLPDERRERVAELRKMMDRADVTISEKYRRLLEAYQIENEYGRTIEAYRDSLDLDGVSRSVDFLRVGRIALMYQTLDGEESGAWDQGTRSWVPLDSGYRLGIREGLRMARKQVAPDLIRVPLPAAEDLR